MDCDDGDVCTVDVCLLGVGCVNTLTPPDGAADAPCDGGQDCDASVDEDYIVPEITCGAGPCSAVGVTRCDAGGHIVGPTPSDWVAGTGVGAGARVGFVRGPEDTPQHRPVRCGLGRRGGPARRGAP